MFFVLDSLCDGKPAAIEYGEIHPSASARESVLNIGTNFVYIFVIQLLVFYVARVLYVQLLRECSTRLCV